MTKRYVFTKKRESIPLIKQGEIINQKAGGIKLEYEIHATNNIRIKIGNRDFYISYWRSSSMKVTFIKLLKMQWDNDHYKLSNNHWNKKDKLYTNLWLILESVRKSLDCYEDVVDITNDVMKLRINTMCDKKEHHQIIKHLDKRDEVFCVPYEQIFY